MPAQKVAWCSSEQWRFMVKMATGQNGDIKTVTKNQSKW